MIQSITQLEGQNVLNVKQVTMMPHLSHCSALDRLHVR